MLNESKTKILLADDEEFLLDIMKENLEELGYEVITAKDGLETFKKFKEVDGIRLILTDVNMPNLNGLDMIKKLIMEIGFAPVLVITGSGDISTVKESLRLGAIDFIEKPFETSLFVEKMDVWLEISRRLQKKTELLEDPFSKKAEALLRVKNSKKTS